MPISVEKDEKEGEDRTRVKGVDVGDVEDGRNVRRSGVWNDGVRRRNSCEFDVLVYMTEYMRDSVPRASLGGMLCGNAQEVGHEGQV